jgi:hypothetical protein
MKDSSTFNILATSALKAVTGGMGFNVIDEDVLEFWTSVPPFFTTREGITLGSCSAMMARAASGVRKLSITHTFGLLHTSVARGSSGSSTASFLSQQVRGAS